ncbi:MAG: hypothetical protein A3F16_06070 [Deltaproteobacteria bacterium RIFCSPHIGHO2_12_FULL_43_9]|nr:MAG: hypothetical protein A3F16_06070 [Deltaproteobacteria bacterium RIFCSPHIGHO2_12_FULL_43_9]
MQKIIHVAIAGCAVGLPGTRVRTVGIGSCVVVALYDPKARVGGMFHAMLPSRKGSSHKSKEKEVASNGLDPKYVDEALGQLILEIEKKGGRVRNLKATIIGGASMFSHLLDANHALGRRNTEAVRILLNQMRIPIVSEDTGGNVGRLAELDIETGLVEISKKVALGK